MSVSAPEILQLNLDDFSGGLNLRDAEARLSPRETPDCMNVTFDDRGGVMARLGYTIDGAMAALAGGDISNGYFSEVLGQLVVQAGARLWRRTAAGAYTEIERAAGADAFTTSARAGFCDFRTTADGAVLIAVHPVDGVLKFNLTLGVISVVTAAVRGDSCVVWQNKVWVTGDPNNRQRVWWCNAGDAGTWTTASDFNDIRDDNDQDCVAIIGVPSIGGGDAAGSWRAVLVCKETSVHRVVDSSTGAYVTIGLRSGMAGPLAWAALDGWAYLLSSSGIFRTDGLSPPRSISGRIEPLFHPTQVAVASGDAWCGGLKENRIVFSVRRAGASENGLTIEYKPASDPEEERGGWFSVHSFGASFFATVDQELYHGDPSGGLVFETFSGATDNGTAITARWRTPALQPLAGAEFRCRRGLILGRGLNTELTMSVKLSRDESDGRQHDVDLETTSDAIYGSFVWGDGTLYAGQPPSTYDEVWELGVGRDISVLFVNVGSTLFTTGQVLADGASEDEGPFALYQLKLDLIPLGI